jgi:glycosyltransferase involved in cell wall biosynthesis
MDFYKSNRVDLFVNLSIVEGLPVSIMEALSYGIPILATAVYGTPEAINENENGYLLDVNFKIEELIGKLSFLMENKNVLEKMREASLKIYQERFHAGKNYARLANELLNA